MNITISKSDAKILNDRIESTKLSRSIICEIAGISTRTLNRWLNADCQAEPFGYWRLIKVLGCPELWPEAIGCIGIANIETDMIALSNGRLLTEQEKTFIEAELGSRLDHSQSVTILSAVMKNLQRQIVSIEHLTNSLVLQKSRTDLFQDPDQ